MFTGLKPSLMIRKYTYRNYSFEIDCDANSNKSLTVCCTETTKTFLNCDFDILPIVKQCRFTFKKMHFLFFGLFIFVDFSFLSNILYHAYQHAFSNCFWAQKTCKQSNQPNKIDSLDCLVRKLICCFTYETQVSHISG